MWLTGNRNVLERVGNAPQKRKASLHAMLKLTLIGGSVRVRLVGEQGTPVSNLSVETVHFGGGRDRTVRKVEVNWTGGRYSIVSNNDNSNTPLHMRPNINQSTDDGVDAETAYCVGTKHAPCSSFCCNFSSYWLFIASTYSVSNGISSRLPVNPAFT